MPTLTEQLQANIRAVTGTVGQYYEDWHALCDLAGIAKGQINERVLAYYNSFNTPAISTFSAAMNTFLLNPSTVTNGTIPTLFAAGEQGAWYAPDDPSTMFQDSAGTTPVTATTQPVGLALDKRLGLTRGADIGIPFVAGGTGWTVTNADSTHIATFGAGSLRYQSDTTTPQLLVEGSVGMTVGKTYELTGTVSAYVSGSLKVNTAASLTPIAQAAGSFRAIFVSTSTVLSLTRNATNMDVTIGNLSLKEIPGNHATQATSTSRPTETAINSLLLDGVDDSLASATGGGGTGGFLFCAAIKPSSAGVARTLWSDAGTNTGYRVRINASNQLELSAGNGTALTTVATVATLASGTAYVVTAWHDGVNLSVQVNSLAVATAAFGAVTAGTAGFTIGKDNGAASSFYAGDMFEVIYRNTNAPSASQIAGAQRYCANKGGVTL